jgi:threonine dehydrogenase-like Zn-dependent dehydrogenase
MDDGLGALIEPLAVALHAVKRAGPICGKCVLVAGGGPIGLLVAMTARVSGAVPVALSDLLPARCETALRLAADAVLDPRAPELPEQVKRLVGDGFEIVFEASGSPAALRQAFSLVRPGGTIVQIGTLGTQDVPLPANQVMARELQFLGSFRYGDVFDEAIKLASLGRLNLQPLISRVLPLERVAEAMELALAKDGVLKLQLQTTQ